MHVQIVNFGGGEEGHREGGKELFFGKQEVLVGQAQLIFLFSPDLERGRDMI
jgi:hypothetical protein